MPDGYRVYWTMPALFGKKPLPGAIRYHASADTSLAADCLVDLLNDCDWVCDVSIEAVYDNKAAM